MRLDTTQQMRTEMRLRMAPRMIQSMEILQLPIMALQERIEQELGENPMLEDLRDSVRTESDEEQAAAPAAAESAPESEPDEFDNLIARRKLERDLRRGAETKPGVAQRRVRSQAGSDAEHGIASPLVPR